MSRLQQQQQQHNPLTAHPFFQINGIDPNAPATSQIQQIDQINTLLLREIDENFARFHQLWRSFFEAAAAQQITLEGENSSVFAPSGQSNFDDETITIPRDDSYLSAAQQEGSFVFQPATSSTPLPGRTFPQDHSWEDSMESPFERMNRKLEDLQWEGNYAESSSEATPSLPSGYSLPHYSASQSAYDVSTGTVGPPAASGPSFTQDAATPKARQSGQKWNGITDLRHTPLSAKFSMGKGKQTKPTVTSKMDDLSLDDSDDEMRMTMSPPVTMKFALPPRVSAIMDLAKTPLKEMHSVKDDGDRQGEARMIVDDLLEAMSTDSPAMPEPKEFGRYSIAPPNYEPGRRLFDTDQASSSRGQPAVGRRSTANTSYGSDIIEEPNNITMAYVDAEDSFGDDSFDSGYGETIPQSGHDVHAEYGDVTQSDEGDVSSKEVFGDPGKMQPGLKGSNFKLLKQDEMLTYRGGKLEDAAGAEMHHSPTALHANRR